MTDFNWWAPIGFVAGMLLTAAIFVGGCAALSKSPVTPDEAASVLDNGISIGGCQAKGKAAKDAGVPDAYGVYDDCMREAGLR